MVIIHICNKIRLHNIVITMKYEPPPHPHPLPPNFHNFRLPIRHLSKLILCCPWVGKVVFCELILGCPNYICKRNYNIVVGNINRSVKNICGIRYVWRGWSGDGKHSITMYNFRILGRFSKQTDHTIGKNVRYINSSLTGNNVLARAFQCTIYDSDWGLLTLKC